MKSARDCEHETSFTHAGGQSPCLARLRIEPSRTAQTTHFGEESAIEPMKKAMERGFAIIAAQRAKLELGIAIYSNHQEIL